MERENFPQYYTILFNGIADALKALDQQETSRAWDILVRIQQEAEDAYILSLIHISEPTRPY